MSTYDYTLGTHGDDNDTLLDEAHAGCLDDMLSGIAAVAAENLKAYVLGIADKDVVDWLEITRDNLMDNLLWQDWGNASDHIPRDRRAHCEQVWRAAKGAKE